MAFPLDMARSSATSSAWSCGLRPAIDQFGFRGDVIKTDVPFGRFNRIDFLRRIADANQQRSARLAAFAQEREAGSVVPAALANARTLGIQT